VKTKHAPLSHDRHRRAARGIFIESLSRPRMRRGNVESAWVSSYLQGLVANFQTLV